ncbi:glucosyltransferase [Richelia sinica FACHB-800]|uniref:Glucosyltransferase n=1 Tax=Richelia sinica FACHB-800 TaxID=1357546 RepID=A0A975Y4L7_9NOST|nr:PssD/Cps14F family polysaccharide biosynthesis glycosyltransferase [Richelia sinica]MBD2666008.1 UDP-N-acetylglucosamine--LPS N-acetylglucosamine transferase [Richelia sinica FACHB-800]QXE23309.1 glucosyltransferase [Richelia sinica FACHB-800]
MKFLLVCSSGGHFKALQQLHPFWENQERLWVTFRTATTEAELTEEKVFWAYSPTNRNFPNFCRNLLLAWQVIRKNRPDVIISTGAGVAVPFLILGKLFGKKTIFIESITRINTLSLSAKLTLPFLSILYVQWPQLQARYPQAELVLPQEL